MYFLVMEYDKKTALAPPFSLVVHTFLFVKWLVLKICRRDRNGSKNIVYNLIYEFADHTYSYAFTFAESKEDFAHKTDVDPEKQARKINILAFYCMISLKTSSNCLKHHCEILLNVPRYNIFIENSRA